MTKLLTLSTLALCTLTILVQGCSSSDAAPAPNTDAGLNETGSADSAVDSSAVDSSTADSTAADSTAADSTATDSASDAPTSWCEELKTYQAKCNSGTVECGANFSLWCSEQSKTNSKIFEETDTVCLPKAGCTNNERSDCRYRLYDPSKLSDSQKQLLEEYCKTCNPSNVDQCKTASLAYDPAKGPSSVDDIFIAVWEFPDNLTDEIRTLCTGSALSLDGGSCAKAFSSCAADPYLNALPECP